MATLVQTKRKLRKKEKNRKKGESVNSLEIREVSPVGLYGRYRFEK